MTSLSCNFFQNNRLVISIVSLLIISSLLSGCDEKEKGSSQVVAKVNSEEITVSQLNGALAGVQVTPGKTVDQVKKEVLDNLIVQKLAEQQAIKAKLDRTPGVMQAIESAKSTIIARAYMDPIVNGIAKPTSDDVHKFYIEHPELFSKRQIYNLRELEVETKPEARTELIASIRDLVSKGQGVDAIATWLKGKNIASKIESGVKSAEQLPLEMLGRLNKMTVGQSMVIEMTQSISVLQIAATKIEPTEENIASKFIQEYLVNTGKKEALENEIKGLKAAAKIEIIGQDVKPAVAEVVQKPVAQSAVADVAKGVAGLK
jgi:EpsD family peptidyl-prolyl cis-trans isomerase